MALWGLRVLQSTSNIEVTATLLTRLSLVQRFFAVLLRERESLLSRQEMLAHIKESPDVYMLGPLCRSCSVIHWGNTLLRPA
jgi:hypothetical protein